MNIALLIIILVVIFAFVLYLRLRGKADNEATSSQSEATQQGERTSEGSASSDGTDESNMDFEKDFFARTQAGEKSQLLMSVASQQDCLMLRSLLFAEGIPSYVEGEHMNNVYGGISGTMTTVVAVKLYILCADYDRAKEIIESSNIKDFSGITIFKKEVYE